MKLEIRHLAGYLPYGLKVAFEADEYPHEVVGLNISREGLELISLFGDYGRAEISMAKPILRPLSDLTKEINHVGKKFIPILELAKVSDSFYKWEYNKESLFFKSVFCYHNNDRYKFSINANNTKLYSFNTTLNGHFIQTNSPHLIYKKLHEYHFDIFGLIEKGLAIDINTLHS